MANNSVSNNIIGIINKGFTYTANNLVYETENRGRLKFSGNSSFITTTYTLTAGQALTVMGWLYSTETTAIYRNFFDSATNNPMIWWDETGKIEFDAGTYLTASTYRNQWTHVSISKPSGSGAPSYYVNGSLVGSGNSYSVPAVTPSFFYENGNNNEAWKGYATVVQLYDRALSDLEIYNNYTVHRGRFGI